MISEKPAKPRGDRKPAAATEQSANGVRLALRRRQRLPLHNDIPEHVFFVESGCLTLDAMLSSQRRQVMLILYPGDIICRSAAPPMPDTGLTAMRPSNVMRFLDDRRSGLPHGLDRVAALARLAARSSLHGIAIGRLSGEERLASLLVEMAIRLGNPIPGGCSFEIPLSRNDMADYLALNPDTLSRLVSRLRARSILAMPTRSRVIIRDLDALAALTPLASALREITAPSEPQLALAECG